MKQRRQAREIVLQTLYAHEADKSEECIDVYKTICNREKYSDETLEYSEKLIKQIINNKDENNKLLQKHTTNWDINRLAIIDRSVLTIALNELRFCREIPYKVIIDEAIEIAKKYGTDKSGKFVNGILDTIRKEINK